MKGRTGSIADMALAVGSALVARLRATDDSPLLKPFHPKLGREKDPGETIPLDVALGASAIALCVNSGT